MNFIENDLLEDNIYKSNLKMLHPDIQRDIEMNEMYYEKYINSSENYIKQKYIDQFFETKYENYISISSNIKYCSGENYSIYSICKFYAIYFNNIKNEYYFKNTFDYNIIFTTNDWIKMKEFIIKFIDEYINNIKEEEEKKIKKMFEDIRKYILIKGISKEEFVNMIKL